jgi:hypothetical protein
MLVGLPSSVHGFPAAARQVGQRRSVMIASRAAVTASFSSRVRCAQYARARVPSGCRTRVLEHALRYLPAAVPQRG